MFNISRYRQFYARLGEAKQGCIVLKDNVSSHVFPNFRCSRRGVVEQQNFVRGTVDEKLTFFGEAISERSSSMGRRAFRDGKFLRAISICRLKPIAIDISSDGVICLGESFNCVRLKSVFYLLS